MHISICRAIHILSLSGLVLAGLAVVVHADEFPGTPPTDQEFRRLARMVPSFDDAPGRRVFIDVVPSALGSPVLNSKPPSSTSWLVDSDLPAVFEVSTDLTAWYDAALGSRLSLQPALATAPRATFVRAWAAVEPISVYLPPAYDEDPDRDFPLVVVLHPYTWHAQRFMEEGQWASVLPALADELGFVIAAPQRATLDPSGQPFWNATRACCDIASSGRPDIEWTLLAVASIQSQLRIDRDATFAAGHSNGAVLCMALAAHSDIFAAVASVSGRTGFPDEMPPPIGDPVHALMINGTEDERIPYTGGYSPLGLSPYPGVQESAVYWAARYGLTEEWVDSEPTLDLLTGSPILETSVQVFRNPVGGPELELWIHNGGHSPTIQPGFARSLVTWLLSHRRSS